MSQVCTCKPDTVKIVRPEKGDPYCNVCGHFWNPKYGSQIPTNNAVYGGVPRSQSEIGKQLKQAKNVARRLMPKLSAPTLGRNEPCHCKSGKKFKKCCGDPAKQAKKFVLPFPLPETQSDTK